MLATMKALLTNATDYALGAFNVYNLEGAKAVIQAAEAHHSPAMLQIHPGALQHGGKPLVALCLAAAQQSTVPIAVHLDHSDNADDIQMALEAGVTSIMADGSHHDYAGNLAFTREMAALAHQHNIGVEAELGRIGGTEDGLTVEEFEARLTDPTQAAEFVAETQIDALAVCIGNVHGKYPRPPQFDFERLAQLQAAVDVPLVLHGASGVPDDMVKKTIELGVRKFNVNTEVRKAYLSALKNGLTSDRKIDLVDLMAEAESAMQAVITQKLILFGSIGKA